MAGNQSPQNDPLRLSLSRAQSSDELYLLIRQYGREAATEWSRQVGSGLENANWFCGPTFAGWPIVKPVILRGHFDTFICSKLIRHHRRVEDEQMCEQRRSMGTISHTDGLWWCVIAEGLSWA